MAREVSIDEPSSPDNGKAASLFIQNKELRKKLTVVKHIDKKSPEILTVNLKRPQTQM